MGEVDVIVVDYELNKDNFIKGLNQASDALSEQGELIDQNGQKVSALGNKFDKTGHKVAVATMNGSQGMKSLVSQTAAVTKETDKLNSELDDTSKKVTSLKAQYKQAMLDAQDGIEGAAEKAGQLKDEIDDTNEAIRNLATGSKLEAFNNQLGTTLGKIASLDFGGAADAAKELEVISKSISFKDTIGQVGQLGNAFGSLAGSILTNPIFILGGVIAATAYIVNEYIKTTDNLTAAQRTNVEVQKKASDSYAEEKTQLIQLVETAKNENLSRRERQEAIEKLQETYPRLLKNISLENIGTEQMSNALQTQIKLIDLQTRLKASQELQIEKTKEQMKAENSALEDNTSLLSQFASANGNVLFAQQQQAKNKQSLIDKNKKEAQSYRDNAIAIQEQIDAIIKSSNVQNEFTDKELEAQKKANEDKKEANKKYAEDKKERDEKAKDLAIRIEHEKIQNIIDELAYQKSEEERLNAERLKQKEKDEKEHAEMSKQILKDVDFTAAELDDNAYEREKENNKKRDQLRNDQIKKDLDAFNLKVSTAKDYVGIATALNDALNQYQDQNLKEGEKLSIDEQEKRFNRSKLLALANIGINTAEGVSKAVAASPLTFGLPFSAFVAATGLVQAGVVASKEFKPQGFAEGTPLVKGGIPNQDSVHALLMPKERVVTVDDNMKYWHDLEAMRTGKYDSYIRNKYVLPELRAQKANAANYEKESFAGNIANSIMMNGTWKGKNITDMMHDINLQENKRHKELVKSLSKSGQRSLRNKW